MPVVTALRAETRARVAVELDGDLWRTLPAEPVVRAGLRVGCKLDRPAARRLRRELRAAEALAVAARALRARDLPAHEVDERLTRAHVAPAIRREALGALARAGAVGDHRFATARGGALGARGYGDAAIAADLERRGVPDELRADALAGLEPEADRACALARERGRGPKTARFL